MVQLARSFEEALIDERIEMAKASPEPDFGDHFITTASEGELTSAREMRLQGLEPDNSFTILNVFYAHGRPAFFIRENSIDLPENKEWGELLQQRRVALESLIPSVGLILRSNVPAGTGFMVDGKFLLTNRHVVKAFADGTGSNVTIQRDQIGNPYVIQVEFRAEDAIQASQRHAVRRIVDMSSDTGPDLALLELETHPQSANYPVFGAPPPTDTAVAAIGYPSNTTEIYSDRMRERIRLIFAEKFDVKRLSPGKIVRQSDAIFVAHDCSTLGGSSGSPLIDIDSGRLLGVHSTGTVVANIAVAAAQVETYIDAALK